MALRAHRPSRRTTSTGTATSSRQLASSAARQGFLAGLNEVLALGALVCFAGAVLSLWLVREREREIEREPVMAAVEPGPEALPEAGAA